MVCLCIFGLWKFSSGCCHLRYRFIPIVEVFHNHWRLWSHFLGLSFLLVSKSTNDVHQGGFWCLLGNILWTPSKFNHYNASHEKSQGGSQRHFCSLSHKKVSCYSKEPFYSLKTHCFQNDYELECLLNHVKVLFVPFIYYYLDFCLTLQILWKLTFLLLIFLPSFSCKRTFPSIESR